MAVEKQAISQPMTGTAIPGGMAASATIDDFELLRRYIGHSDSQAFAQIVQRYAGFVYATCLRVIGNSARAEDLSQETFFRLMRQPHEIRQNLGGWLHRTATHLALDALRSETSRRKREIAYTRDCDREASTWAELSPSVDQALTEMPEELRHLLVSHFLMGRSQSDLAVEAGQSPSTISRRMQQALEELRQRLRLKGLYALPAALVGLMCHLSARQAPAKLMFELGKMSMVSGMNTASRIEQFGSADPKCNPLNGRIVSRFFSVQVGVAFIGMVIAALVLQWLIVAWRASSIAAHGNESQNHSVTHQASVPAGSGGSGKAAEKSPGLAPNAVAPR